MFQSSGLIHADEIPVNSLTIDDIDAPTFNSFLEKEYDDLLENQSLPLGQLLRNMRLAKDSNLNIAGALLFAQKPHFHLPAFIVKAVAFPDSEVNAKSYTDSRDIVGRIIDIFEHTLSFLNMNIRHVQKDKSINSLGSPVVPRIAFEELVVNALIHRDYFVSAPIRIFIFLDRIEIINPGHLPNNLTIEGIKSGVSNIRNPILASYATKILPYRGLGSGVRRALREYPHIEFFDDRDNNQFKAVVSLVYDEGS